MALDRTQMLARLKAMPSAEFEELIFNARIRDIIPANEPQTVRAIRVIEYFEGSGTHQDLSTLESLLAVSSLSHSSTLPPATPYVSIAHLPSPVANFVGRDAELAQLDAAWESADTNVFTIVAFGGVGKSSLVAEWLQRLGRDLWRGAEVVLGHSFYSQGSRDEAQVSAEPFIDSALKFFGDPDPETGSAWDKGERLARLMRQRRTLLVLDGLEPMQWGAANSYEMGRIKDQGLTALVKELAYSNPGLCLITTRQPVADIPTSPQLDLNHLSEQAGAALLEMLGVKGLPEELEAASRQVNGHGLALRLLGTYLDEAYDGDVRYISEIDLSEVVQQEMGGKAFRMMEQYERWLGEGVKLSMLRLLGLFDRPAEPNCIAALCTAPAIPGLTDALVDLSPQDWRRHTKHLIKYGLLTPNSEPTDPPPFTFHPLPSSLSAHPLIREYFATHLATHHPDATREAHRRLYDHLKQAAPELPETLPEMMPLFQAIAHGCKANLHQDALEDIYYRRIQRDGNTNYAMNKLGVAGTELAAVSYFFSSSDWAEPVQTLTEEDQAFVLNVVSFRLRASGRLTEATQPMQRAVEINITAARRNEAAKNASNLSALYLILGNVAAAVRVAEQCVELADRGDDVFVREVNRITVANALHQAGLLSASLAAFRKAEALQAERRPQYPQLYSLQGYAYCDLLLEPGQRLEVPSPAKVDEAAAAGDEVEPSTELERCRQVRARSEMTLKYGEGGYSLLDFALDHLTLGRTWLLEATLYSQSTDNDLAGKNPPPLLIDPLTHPPIHFPFHNATHHLNLSVSLFRQAGTQHHLPRGLLARAALWRTLAEFKIQNSEFKNVKLLEQADRDLTEVEQIATRSGMVPYLVDAALERCRLALVQGDPDQARAQLAEGKALVQRTEHPYEPHIPTWAEWRSPEYIGAIQPGEIVGYHRRNGEIAELTQILSA